MKRLLASVLTLLLLLASFLTVPVLAATEVAGGKYYGIDWRFDDQTDTLILSGTGDMPEPQDKFPWYNKYPWFKVRFLTKHLVIQEGITEIGREAFHGFSELEDVSLPQSLEEIGEQAFSECTSLRSIELPGKLTRIECDTFYQCTALKNVVFSKGLWSIDEFAFSGCEALKEAVFPDSLGWIGHDAFYGCKNLKRVTFGENLGEISSYAFAHCRALTEVEFPGSLQRIGYCTFENCTSLKSVTFSEGLREIGDYCFSGCEKLGEIALPKSLKVLGKGAFEDCTSLTQVDFHWGLNMNLHAFDGCGELPEVTRYLLFTKGTPLLVGLLVLLFALVWSAVYLYRTDKSVFCRNLAKRFLTVACAVTLGWLLGLLWDKLELYKRVGDYGIILYMLAELVPEPFRETALEWVDNTYLMAYTLILLLSVAAYQFYVGRCWIRVLGKPGWVLVPAASLTAAKILMDESLSHSDYWLRALTWKESLTELVFYILENGGAIPGIMAAGIVLGLVCLAVWGMRSRKRAEPDGDHLPGWAVRVLCGVSLSIAVITAIWFLITAGEGVWHMAYGRIPWEVLLWILVPACVLWALWASRKNIKELLIRYRSSNAWVISGRIVRVGIIVASVIVGYCIFSVLAHGNYQSEYYAEQITVTHRRESSERKTQYCVDFVERELRYYDTGIGDDLTLQWTKPLEDQELEAFMEACNNQALLGRSYTPVGKTPGEIPGDYCLIHTYSNRGERLVFDGSGYYPDKEALVKALDKVFYDLTGICCLTDP